MSPQLTKLNQTILANGKIDTQEIDELRSLLLEDGIIDTEEAEMIFDLNNAVSNKRIESNYSLWGLFFTDAISSYLLNDEYSPNEIDEQEGQWLITQLEGDSKIDNNEKALLLELNQKALKMPNNLKSFIADYL